MSKKNVKTNVKKKIKKNVKKCCQKNRQTRFVKNVTFWPRDTCASIIEFILFKRFPNVLRVFHIVSE